MKLRGQHGYAMAALIVALSVMAILLSAAMPAWRQMVRREKETELVFRGEQYARAIGLFQKKAGPGVLPPDLDVLIDQKYLRKKYKDPITGEDFDLLRLTPGNSSAPGQVGGVATPAPTPSGGRGLGAGAGGIMGVASKSKEESLRVYNGRTHYNEWQFLFVQQAQAPGGAGGPGNQGRNPQPNSGRGGGLQPQGQGTQQGGSGGFPQGGSGGAGRGTFPPGGQGSPQGSPPPFPPGGGRGR